MKNALIGILLSAARSILGKQATYVLISKTQLTDPRCGPYIQQAYVWNKGKPEPVTIRYAGIPNEAMRPTNWRGMVIHWLYKRTFGPRVIHEPPIKELVEHIYPVLKSPPRPDMAEFYPKSHEMMTRKPLR